MYTFTVLSLVSDVKHRKLLHCICWVHAKGHTFLKHKQRHKGAHCVVQDVRTTSCNSPHHQQFCSCFFRAHHLIRLIKVSDFFSKLIIFSGKLCPAHPQTMAAAMENVKYLVEKLHHLKLDNGCPAGARSITAGPCVIQQPGQWGSCSLHFHDTTIRADIEGLHVIRVSAIEAKAKFIFTDNTFGIYSIENITLSGTARIESRTSGTVNESYELSAIQKAKVQDRLGAAYNSKELHCVRV